MNIESFIEKLAAEFEEVELGTLKPETNFRDLDDWSSMYALIVIALIDTEYDVRIKGEDLSKIETVQELYDLVDKRKD
jgi:acyl carrier protein